MKQKGDLLKNLVRDTVDKKKCVLVFGRKGKVMKDRRERVEERKIIRQYK